MRSSAKRKILILSEEDTDQDSVSDIDSQPTKKGKGVALPRVESVTTSPPPHVCPALYD